MPNLPNPTNKFSLKTLLIFSPLLILYIMVLFGFSIRENVPFEYHFLFPVAFIAFFILFIFKSSAMARRLKLSGFYAFGFVIVNVLVLYFNSSIKREVEIRNYVERNEKELLDLVNYFQRHGADSTLHAMEKKLNISAFDFGDGNYSFRMYKFAGYGYDLTYTDSVNMETPIVAPNKSPIIKWMKVKAHWYYYSYFD